MMHSYGAKSVKNLKVKCVLILVVMDDALVHPKSRKGQRFRLVLILVVMDDALVQTYQSINGYIKNSLNPCCNG